MRCEDVMKRQVECVLPSETTQAAARRMHDQNVGFLPVCDQSRRVIGVITDRDIAIRLVAQDRGADTPIEQIMTRQVVACRPGDDLEEAERLMGSEQKSRIMCVDDSGRLIGVISLSDIAQREDSQRAAETMRQVTDREVWNE